MLIYQWPFNPPSSFIPTVLASGTADESGVFSAVLPTSAPAVRGPWKEGSATLVNAIIKAVDPTNRWLVRYDAVLPLDASYSDTLAANADLSIAWPSSRTARAAMSSGDLLEIGRIDRLPRSRTAARGSGVSLPSPTSIVGETTRQVKVLEMHAGTGMHVVFTYATGQATQGSTAVKVGGTAGLSVA